ncbi:MAG: hypothetical protein GY861_15745 [bacterium]|nr:hypothetical protein [bacterium]
MKNRKKRLEKKIRTSDARNTRQAVYKYYPIDETKSIAVRGGRCHKCNKITNDFCISCTRFVCDKHSHKKSKDKYCADCKENKKVDYIN